MREKERERRGPMSCLCSPKEYKIHLTIKNKLLKKFERSTKIRTLMDFDGGYKAYSLQCGCVM